LEKYNITDGAKPSISEQDISDKLKAGKDISSQPTFIDVLYLQLDLISNLSDSLLLEKPNLAFSGLFLNDSDFQNYNKWLDKFSAYNTKKEFQDAFSGAITLKDI
jgi:hypothetical protein